MNQGTAGKPSQVKVMGIFVDGGVGNCLFQRLPADGEAEESDPRLLQGHWAEPGLRPGLQVSGQGTQVRKEGWHGVDWFSFKAKAWQMNYKCKTHAQKTKTHQKKTKR